MKKIDFTASSAKAFVNTMSKAYQGYFGMGEVRSKLSKTVAENKNSMDNAKARLDTLEEGDERLEKYQSAYELCKEFYDKTKAKLDKALEVEKKRIDGARSLFDSEDLYSAYKDYVSGGLVDDTAMAEELAKIFVKNGLTDATADNVRRYLRAVGTANGNAYRDKSVIKAKAKSATIDSITRSVVQNLIDDNGIDTSKYTYYEKPAKKASK